MKSMTVVGLRFNVLCFGLTMGIWGRGFREERGGPGLSGVTVMRIRLFGGVFFRLAQGAAWGPLGYTQQIEDAGNVAGL